jgi:LacI family transcriptional regulator
MHITHRVAILTPPDTPFSRRIQHGIVKYAYPARPWLLGRRGCTPRAVEWLRRWGADGIIGYFSDRAALDAALALRLPVINVSDRLPDALAPTVRFNDEMIGELAARHFLDRGFRSAGFVGYENFAFSVRRGQAFEAAMKAGGATAFDACRVGGGGPLDDEESWSEVDDQIIVWLQSLQKPAAVFACGDALAGRVAEACRLASLRIPDVIALLGCDNDDLLCRMAQPGLSSVDLPVERVGYEAASLLDRLMENSRDERSVETATGVEPRDIDRAAGPRTGAAAPASPGGEAPALIRLPPVGVVSRPSTEVLSIEDVDVAGAVRFIRDHAGENIGVREVVLAGRVDRRTLERRFRNSLQRTILEEIRRVRLESAKEMLANTDLPMPVVAQRSGFSDAKQLSLVFHEEVGTQPTSYRRQFRLHDSAID